MKRTVVLVAGGLLTSLIVGCDSGIKEGAPPEPVTSSQTADFRAAMEKAGSKMTKGQMKGQPARKAPAPAPAPEKTSP